MVTCNVQDEWQIPVDRALQYKHQNSVAAVGKLMNFNKEYYAGTLNYMYIHEYVSAFKNY